MNDRLDRIRAAMAEEQLDALYISGAVDDVYGRHSQNRHYSSGFSGSAGVVLVTRDRAVVAVDSRYVEQAGRESAPHGFEVWKTDGRRAHWVPELLKHADLCGKKVAVSAADMTVAEFEGLRRAVEGMAWGLRPTVGTASPIIEKLRKRKDSAELAALQRAITIGDQAFERVEAGLKPEMTERQVADAIERAIRDLGGDGLSFETIVAAGPWAALAHATPRDVAVGEGQPLVVDMGALAGGYCSDLTRTTVLGRLAPEMRAIYEIVFEAQLNAIERVEPGMSGDAAHALAFDVIAAAGHGEHFGHGLGHGVGLEVHEGPYLGKTSEDTLEEGMVFTIEPGIYVPGLGGVRIEDVVVLENGKARVLSHARKLTPAGV
jgi:Xaa-Pro aminopeptidase